MKETISLKGDRRWLGRLTLAALVCGGVAVAPPPLAAQGKKGKPPSTERQATAPKPTPTPTPVAATKRPPTADYQLDAPVSVPALPVTQNPAEPAQQPGAKPPTKPATQTPQEPEPSGDTFRISSNLVAVPVSVTNANGEPVRNLRAEDFRLEEEGQPQQVQSLGEPGKTPLELVLLFDISGSVRERFEFEKVAALRFLREVLKPQDTVTVFSIGFDPKLVIERTSNVDKIAEGLARLEPTKEGTAFFDTVVKAAQYLNDHAATGTRRVVVVISDGEDNHSEVQRLADAQRELQRSDTIFYAINPSGPSIRLNKISMRGHNGMATLANDTGGVAFLPDQESELERVFKQIAAELQAQYLLGYYSSNEANDGRFRRIKIQLPSRPDLRIRARQGYYAPRD
jgi:Ca-activated chloride channel homolog